MMNIFVHGLLESKSIVKESIDFGSSTTNAMWPTKRIEINCVFKAINLSENRILL